MSNYKFYPKQFRNAKIPIEKNRCFVLMPFQNGLEFCYGSLKKALQDSGFVCNRADELIGKSAIMTNVINEIIKSHFIIVDLTGQNPNVFYELGIAHSFKDAQNIILIAQSIDDVPFDVRHLRVIIYSPDNLMYLTASVLQTLEEFKRHYGFYEALQRRGLIRVIEENLDEFIGYFQSKMEANIEVLSSVFDGESRNLDEEEVEALIKSVEGVIHQAASERYTEYVAGITRILCFLLESTASYPAAQSAVRNFLYNNTLLSSLPDSDLVSLQTDLAISLADRQVCFSLCMNWIIEYLGRSKSASIDLNRYKIESFLMTTPNDDVNELVIASLFHNNNYIREHIADIVGEKRIINGMSALLAQLEAEENIYTTASLISALGKLKQPEAAENIVNWFKRNESSILSQKNFFLIRHIHRALARLNNPNVKHCIVDIQSKYRDHLIHSFVI